ncbi:murinoglobulin-1-like isoform X1 [Hylaeus anthracinus]|uniref:murinoglobulin-1-like isoform X1 n=1 Tax=Hylaeus anthracinus TaxID=313031 RepID=UPI0023B9B022|nr:murinoglobulin-1-like isoform X1 [Hylaeus anthracinus]
MDRPVFLVLLVCSVALFHSYGTGATVNRGYVFTAPKRLLAGETESGCVSLHNLEPPAHVLLELLSPSSVQEEEVLASTSSVIKTGIETCLELIVPSTKYSNARLRLKMNFDKHRDYVVESEKEVYIEHDSLITFVETDKPVYKPGQDVNIRVLMLKHDLKPWKKEIPKVWIENPSEVRVAQWTNVSTETGMAQLLFPLSPEPSLGTWKIKVEKKRSHPQLVHTTMFEVKKYVLPRFQLTISSPGYILADAEDVTWNICAKYSYGKPVKGTLFLKSTPQTPSWRRKLNLPEIHYETELDTRNGCTEYVLSGAALGLARWKVAPNNIVLIANFTEAGTGVVETTISRTMVMHQALKLEFVSHTPKYFKLGLPYHGKLRVLRHDDTPAPNEKIQLCLKVRGKDEMVRVVVECRNFTSSADGFVDFIVPPPHKNIVLLSFVATGVDYPTKYYSPDKRWRVFMDQPSAHIDVNPWYSPSDSYLAVARGYQPIECGEKYSFNVMYTVPSHTKPNESISFHYSINSKGDLLIYGHVKHKPSRDTILNYSEFHNLLGAVESPTNKTDQGSDVHRFPLSVKVTPSMAPVSELLLYYVRPDGEIVATTYTIEVGHCFENKVKSAWHTDVQTPGGTTQYHVEAAPWSLCGISAVDKSTLFLAGSKPNLVDASQTFDQLKRFHPTPETHPIWSWANCKPTAAAAEESMEEIDHLPLLPLKSPFSWIVGRRRRNLITYNAGVNYVDAIQAFDDFGVVVMSDLIIETRPCPLFFRERSVSPWFKVQMMREDMDEPDMLKAMQPTAFPLINFAVSAAEMSPEVGYVDQLPDQTTTLRSYFPETWLWELIPTEEEGKVTIDLTLPHTITDWVGYTTCISPIHGLGIAPPTTITAFQPFFLDYSLPYSVKRGEMLRMKVSLYNYMQHKLPVAIKLEDAPGLDLHLSHPKASFCVKPRGSVVHEFILRPRVIGEVNITVSASIDPDYAEPCGPDTLIFTRDIIVKPILIQPEGFPMETTKSSFICPKDFSDDSTIVWDLILPEDVVSDSGRAYVNLIGDILGPALENLNKLVQLPMGCGEQNMILLVPNIHVIRYLDAAGIENPALRATAIKNMEKGYQRELNYRHPDGSYSAFGPDSLGDGSSIWLTAFVLKSFSQARSLIHIDERELKLSVKWIVKKQLENGCFPVVGRVFHKEMKGGLQEYDSSSSALTAYILISLFESGVPLSATLISNALFCLEKGMINNNDGPYTAVLSTYALALLEHPKANASMKLLMDRATHHNDLLWWEDKTKPSLSLSIEMTAYAVLTLVELGGEENMVHALKAVRWMSRQRNANGGFTSTQDTVLGLEALTKYAMAVNSNATDLSVLVTAGEVDQVYRMHNDNRMVLTQIRLPVLPTIVEIFAEGEGCVLVQSNIKYNVAHATGSEAFELSVAAHSVACECAVQEITACGRYKLADEESNMALLEIGMISGYVPDRASLHTLLGSPTTRVKRFEENNDVVTIYFDKLTSRKTCISFTVIRENAVDRLEPANVKLYDYYQQELTVSSSYNFSPTCSSADPNEEPRPPVVMPRVELFAALPADKSSLQEENLKSDAPMEKSAKKKANERVDEKINNKIVDGKSVSPKGPSLVNKLQDDATSKREKMRDIIEEASISGVRPKIDNVPLVENSNPKINEDEIDSMAHVRTTNDNSIVVDHSNTPQVESGSGLTPDEPDSHQNPNFDSNIGTSDNAENLSTIFTKETEGSELPGNPSFVVVSHELETPKGIEGPVPVYVKPDNFDYRTEATVATLTPEMENQNLSQEESDGRTKNATNSDAQVSSPTSVKQSCPVCVDNLPTDFYNVYCSASSAVKVAIRRLNKARLLLDLHASREVQRLRATVEFTLDSSCSCSPLDSPGSLALIVNKDNDILASGDHKQILNNSFSVYGLPSVSGVPREITDARSACPNQTKDQSTYVDPPVGG